MNQSVDTAVVTHKTWQHVKKTMGELAKANFKILPSLHVNTQTQLLGFKSVFWCLPAADGAQLQQQTDVRSIHVYENQRWNPMTGYTDKYDAFVFEVLKFILLWEEKKSVTSDDSFPQRSSYWPSYVERRERAEGVHQRQHAPAHPSVVLGKRNPRAPPMCDIYFATNLHCRRPVLGVRVGCGLQRPWRNRQWRLAVRCRLPHVWNAHFSRCHL